MARIDPTAVVEDGARLAADVSVWQFTKVRTGASVGAATNVGGGVYIGKDVRVGARCKIENGAQLFEGATIGDGVFVGPGVILTNDRRPRAVRPDGGIKGIEDWTAEGVTLHDGAALGAGTVVVAGVTVGAWALVGSGSVVTRDVGDHELVVGNPARRIGWACRCGERIDPPGACASCGRTYGVADGKVVESG